MALEFTEEVVNGHGEEEESRDQQLPKQQTFTKKKISTFLGKHTQGHGDFLSFCHTSGGAFHGSPRLVLEQSPMNGQCTFAFGRDQDSWHSNGTD